jgi:hypothetical protein
VAALLLAAVVMFNVVEPLPLIVAGVKLDVAPVGKPLTAKFAVPVKPFRGEIETE